MRSRNLAKSEILRERFRVNRAHKRVISGMLGCGIAYEELNRVNSELIEPKIAL